MYAPRNMCFKNGFSSAIYIFIFLQELCWGQQRSSRTSSGNRNEEFSCPEEFGYYPHPGDCTLYYVCVFGGALLESCTGGLMYSHELQTCDWPRNVGCGEANGIDSPSAPGIVNTNRVTDTRGPPLQRGRELPQQQSHQQQDHQQPHQQVAKQLYEEEDLGPAEEEETDRQQRVYRGQPSTLSQVARDRDGLPRHTNALQSSPVSGKDKLSVVSYGSNQQYRTDLIPRVSTENFEHDNKLDAYKTKRRRKRQLYSSRPVNARWPHLLPPGSKIIAHVNPMQGLALQQASGDNMYSPSHYYLFPATPPPAPPPPGPGVPQSIQSQNYRNGATPQIIDLKSYFQLPNPPNINQPHPLHPPHNLIAHQGAAPPTAGPYNIPNVTPNPIPINTPTLSYATPVPWSAATSQATDRTTLLSMRPNSQIKIYTPMTDQTTPSSSIKMPPKPPGALLANHNLDETVSPQESKGHDYLRNGNHRESPDGQNHHRPNHNKKNQAHGSHHHNHRDDDNVGYPRHRYNESIRHHNEASGTHRQAESFETDPNAGTSDDEGGGGREGDEEDEGGGDDGGGGGGGGSGGEGGGEEEATGSQDAERSNEGGEEAPQIDPPVRNRYKNIPLRDLRNKLRDLDGHFEDPRFKIYMSKLKLKMNEKFPHATRSDESGGSVEFESEKHLGGFSDEFGDSIGDLEDHDDDEGIEPQLIFTTPDTRNIGSFTPTPRPRPTKKPKGAITPLGVSHSYRPANYSYRRNYGHKKNTKPYGESTESYDDLYDTQLHAALPPSSAFDRDECCDEYGNPKQGVGLGAYHSDHGPKNVALSGDNFSEYPRHKGYDSPTPYYSTPAGPPSGKPKVKQKPGPPPPLEGGQKDYDEEYYEDNAQYDTSYDQRRPASDDEGDNEEYYGEGYDDEEYAEDYKHERPGHLNGTHVKAPRPPKMMKHIDHRVKSPAIKYGSSKNNGSNDDEYYDDEYYDDEDYYDDTTTNKVTQPSVRQKFRGSNATDITMDPELSSSVDAYSVLKSSSPSYRRPKTFAPTNFNKSDIMQNERTTPLSETPNPPTPPTPHPAHATTPRYLIKPKFRKKTTPHQSDVDDEAKLTTPNGVPAQNYPVKFSRFKNKLSLSSTPMPKISESGNGSQSHNFTISSKYRKPHRQKLKTYSARNRTVASPTQNRTQDAMLEGAQSNRTPETQTEPPQDSQKFGGKTRVSPKNHRMPTVDGARPLNVKHTNPKDPNSSFQSHPSPSSNRGQNKGENSQDELKIPANHKTQPTGRLVTNNRGTASQRQNPKQLQKQTSTPSAGQATDRVSVAPPNYVSQQAPVQVGIGSSASVANRGIYNGTQYNPSQQQFDSYYNLYNDEAELYGDDDYGQYVSNRGKHPPQIEIVQRLPEKNAVAYTPVQSYKQQENAYTPSYKAQGNVGYTPSYKQQQSDIYNVDDYNQQYSLQGADDDLSYQQPGIIANKPSIRLVAARNESKVNETKQQQHPVHPIPSKPHELVAPLPSQRITLSAAFALENTPNYKSAQPAGFAPNRGGRPTTNFFIVKDDASEPAKKPDEITDEFALKKDVKNIEITRMRASGKNVPQVPSFPPRDTSKPSYVASTLIPPSLPPRRQFNGSSSFSFEDNSNFRIIVDSSPKANPTLATPIGFRFLNNTTKFVPSTTSIPKESPRGTFKPRPFAHPDWIDSVDITSTSARPVTSPEPSNHRFERVNFEKEVAELSRNNPVYHSITKVPVQFTTEASTSRIAIKIPQRIASKVDQSTKKVDVTNAVSRFLSDLSFTTKKPERPRSKLEENDVQRFSTPLTPVSRFWSSPKVEISTVGKAVYPPKYDVKPTEATNFQGRSFFASKENPQNLNANNKPSYNVDKKPSKFDENVEDEEYYDDEYYEDDEVEEEKPKAAPPIPLSTQAPRPPSTSQSPPQPAPVTYKPSIKLPISSLVKEYSFPSKSATRTQTLSRDNEVNNAKESLQNPCSEQNSECNEKPLVSTRVRPAPVSPVTEESQASLDYPRGRPRGSATYTTASSESDRGTPLSSGGRPTLKPSQSIVSKASEFVDIYKFPPRRPESVYPTPQVDKTAAKCRKDVCLLPDCYCGGKDVPGDLSPEETPQLVLLTFDDSVNDLNKGLYSDLFEKGRTNPNGCPISATFYVSHEWTDYSQVQNLYAGGHEIASHSVSHSFGEQFSQKKWTREIAGQREILAAYGGVKQEDIRGMRAPFLAVGGNKMFKMLYDSNFTYDSSMPVYENRPPSWPYTFDYKIFHDCMIPPCPTRSYPGVWEVPMVMWQDLNGGRCSMGDACSNPPTSDGVYKMLVKNFERHFTTNRAPFGLFYHAAWFTQPHHKEAFIAFLDTIVNMPEVWVVTNWQALQWVRDPTPISRLRNFTPFGCDYPDRPRKCNNPKVCNLWHKSGVRYMRTCQPCPDIYPWTGKTGIKTSKVDNEIIQE